MTLTGIGGSLGIGVTQPSTNLQVEGEVHLVVMLVLVII